MPFAGGGGGGFNVGGGGGAGGFIYNPALPTTPGTTYTVAVGAGGAGAVTDTVNGSPGADSAFHGLVAIGGGGGFTSG
jgi:hypothetical protein